MECRAWPELCTDAGCQLEQLSSKPELTPHSIAVVQQHAPAALHLALRQGLRSTQTKHAKHGAQPLHNKLGRQHHATPTSDQMTAQIGLDEGCWIAGTVKAM